MAMETTRDRGEYHEVVADSISRINGLIANKQEGEAKSLLRTNIIYAFTLMTMDDQASAGKQPLSEKDMLERVDKLKLGDRGNVEHLYTLMAYYQHRARITPTHRERFFGQKYAEIRDRL